MHLLSGLIRLVTRRAEEIRDSGRGAGSGMEALRESVDALGHVLDAAELLRGAVGPGEDPRRAYIPNAVSSLIPSAWAIPEPQAEVAEAGFAPFRDQLTGLHSREGFDAVAGGELKRCARHGRVFSLVLLKLSAGDPSVFQRAAGRLRRSLRASDLVGREGDRNLVIALPETGGGDARAIARRIVPQLETAGAWGKDSRVGLGAHPQHGESLGELLEAARTESMAIPGAGKTDTPGGGYGAS